MKSAEIRQRGVDDKAVEENGTAIPNEDADGQERRDHIKHIAEIGKDEVEKIERDLHRDKQVDAKPDIFS